MTTRAAAWQLQFGGGIRRARTIHKCDCNRLGHPCLNLIKPKDEYFDTNVKKYPHLPATDKQSHATKKFCLRCANEEQ